MSEFIAPSEKTIKLVQANLDDVMGYADLNQRFSTATLPMPPTMPLEVTATFTSNADSEDKYELEIKDYLSQVSVKVGEASTTIDVLNHFMQRFEDVLSIDGMARYMSIFESVSDTLWTDDPKPAVQRMISRASGLQVINSREDMLSHRFANGHVIECSVLDGNADYVKANRRKGIPDRSIVTVGANLGMDRGSLYRYAAVPDKLDHQRVEDMLLIEHNVSMLDTTERVLEFDGAGEVQGAYKPTEGGMRRFAMILRTARQGLERELGSLGDGF